MAEKRIIVIEDDPDIAWLAQVRLEAAGYQVSTAPDGAAGLDAFLASGADLVLLDVNLPVMNGHEVFARLREVSQVPIVLMTAYGWDDDRLGFSGLQPECYLAKPFSPKELVARVATVLRESR